MIEGEMTEETTREGGEMTEETTREGEMTEEMIEEMMREGGEMIEEMMREGGEMTGKTIFGMIAEAPTEEETAASTITEASRFTPLLWTEEQTIPNAETIEQIAIIAVTRADTALVATIEASIVMTVMSCITTIAPILLIIIPSINQSHFISPLPFRCPVCSTNTPLILCIPPIHPNRVQHIHASLIIFDPR